MELREEFRYESASRQRDFVSTRFTHIVDGFHASFDPYMEMTLEDTTDDRSPPVNLASKLLLEA